MSALAPQRWGLALSHLALAGALLAGAAGCASDSKAETHHIDHEDAPETLGEAQANEAKALKLVEAANRKHDEVKRLALLDRALVYLRRARQLFEDELVKNPKNPERRRNLEAEIDRLSARISKVHRQRPSR